jgi:hypothetical protein
VAAGRRTTALVEEALAFVRRRELPVAELGRLWRPPGVLVALFLLLTFDSRVRNEARGLYCPACWRRLNGCLTFLTVVFAAGALAMPGVLPGRPR